MLCSIAIDVIAHRYALSFAIICHQFNVMVGTVFFAMRFLVPHAKLRAKVHKNFDIDKFLSINMLIIRDLILILPVRNWLSGHLRRFCGGCSAR